MLTDIETIYYYLDVCIDTLSLLFFFLRNDIYNLQDATKYNKQ